LGIEPKLQKCSSQGFLLNSFKKTHFSLKM